MRNDSPIHMLILPSSFDARELLPRSLHKRADDARYFVSTVFTRMARGQVDDNGYVRLFAQYLRKIMEFRDYSHVIDVLLEKRVVDRVSYHAGKSFGYRLSESYVNDQHIRIPVTDRRLIRRLEACYAERERVRRSRMQPVHESLERHQRRLSIDRDQAAEILAKLPPESNPWDTQNVLIRDIEDKDFHLRIGEYGRVFNNISNLKRELRQALRLGQQPLCNADIRSCQPALLGKQAYEAAKGRKQGETKAGSNYDVQIGGGYL